MPTRRGLGVGQVSDAALYSVPSDPTVPYPVDMNRVEDTLRELGYTLEDAELTASGGTVTISGREYTLAFFGNRDYLSVRTCWDPPRDTPSSYLFTAVNSWNRTRLFPTAYLDTRPDGDREVVADMVCFCTYGLSRAQLRDELSVAVSTCADAVEYTSWVVERGGTLR